MMPKWIGSVLLMLGIFACAGITPAQQTPVVPADKPLSVLFPYHIVDLTMIKEFRDRGIHIDWCEMSQLPRALTRYHVIAFSPGDSNMRDVTPELKAFLNAGGGLLIFGDFAGPGAEGYATSRQSKELQTYLRFLKEELGYGGPVGPPFADSKVDCELSEWWKGFGLSLTTNISPSPVSEGVQRVWFPNGLFGREEWKQSGGMVLSPEWQVALRANVSPTGKPADAPALLALRAWGNGRLAVTQISPIYSLIAGTHSTIRKRVFSTGINNIPSDYGRLLENTIRWLAAPARENGKLGGFILSEERLVTKPRVVQPHDWSGIDGEKKELWLRASPREYTGIIGPRSVLSGGKATVAEYAAAAREMKLDFLVMLEDFAAMTPAKLAELEAACRAVTNETFACYPGLLMRDDADHTCYYFGRELAWPPTACLTRDGKALASRNAKTGPQSRNNGNAMGLGILEFIHDNTAIFKAGSATFPQSFGYCNFTPVKESAPLWDLRVYSSVALELSDGGRVVDTPDAILPDYLRVNQDGNGIHPLAVHLVRSVAELRALPAGGRFLPRVYYANEALPFDRRIMEKLRYAYHGSPCFYISNGPAINAWWVGRYGPFAGNGYEPSTDRGYFSPMPNQRDRLGFQVSADAGLKEVRIWESTRLARRYLFNGEKSARKIIESVHDRARSYVLEVVAVDGTRAISGPNGSGANYAWMLCADRVNGEIVHGPFYFLNRNMIDVGAKIIEMPPLTDAHFPRAGLSLNTMPILYFKAGSPQASAGQPMPLPNQQWQIDLVADNARVIGVKCFKDYLPDEIVANGWNTYGPLAPPRTFIMEQRFTEFWPVNALSVWYDGFKAKRAQRTAILEVEMECVQDFQTSNFDIFQVRVPLQGYQVAAVDPAQPGRLACGPIESWERWTDRDTIPLKRGSYLAGMSLDGGKSGGGIAIVLDDTPFLLKRSHNFLHAVSPDALANGVKKGTKFNYRLLLIGHFEGERPENLGYYAGLHRFLGFTGAPGYAIEMARGTVADRQGVLRLGAQDGAVDFRYNNPGAKRMIRMPVLVSGLNEGWSAGIYYRAGNLAMYPAAIYKGDLLFAIDSDKEAEILAGHPVVAGNAEVVIKVVQLVEKPARFHVCVHNPTAKPVTTEVRKGMPLPGLAFPTQTITLPPGTDWEWEG
ncbi:MAG: hypothetical protein ACYC7E_09115 [Armatimonadota bacterium]